MDKNKWIEEKVKELIKVGGAEGLFNEFLLEKGFLKLESLLRKTLSEAWSKGK